jgi:hypothetical protein
LCSLLSVEDAVLGFGQPRNFARRNAWAAGRGRPDCGIAARGPACARAPPGVRALCLPRSLARLGPVFERSLSSAANAKIIAKLASCRTVKAMRLCVIECVAALRALTLHSGDAPFALLRAGT